jgi:hypothetical protein
VSASSSERTISTSCVCVASDSRNDSSRARKRSRSAKDQAPRRRLQSSTLEGEEVQRERYSLRLKSNQGLAVRHIHSLATTQHAELQRERQHAQILHVHAKTALHDPMLEL